MDIEADGAGCLTSDLRSSSVPSKRLHSLHSKHCTQIAHIPHPSLSGNPIVATSSSRHKAFQEAKALRKGLSNTEDLRDAEYASVWKRCYSTRGSRDRRGAIGLFQRRRTDQKLFTAMLNDGTSLNEERWLHSTVDDDAEAELWVLPDFEEWEMEVDGDVERGEWGTLVERAVESNRERLKRRLEGDGWDFVGGRYGEDEEVSEVESNESVDQEFDVVVLDKS